MKSNGKSGRSEYPDEIVEICDDVFLTFEAYDNGDDSAIPQEDIESAMKQMAPSKEIEIKNPPISL